MPNPNIPNRSLHASYEIIAKNIAGNASASSPADLVILRQYGYAIDRVFNDPVTDLQAVGLRSTDPNKPPLLVFAGTSSALDQLENKNPQGAGFNQFTQNRAAIETWLRSIATDTTKNPNRLLPDLAGHSLGGALVQQTAAALPTLISEAVTFQSFGLNSGSTNKFRQNGGVAGQVTHYVSSGDLVSLMGQEFIAGAAILTTYTTPAIDPQNFIQKHFEYIVPNSTATQAANLSYQELGTDKLNSPNFNYTDRDWIDLRLAISQTDALVAQGLINRQSAEGLRLQFDYFALADRIGKLNLLAGYNASGGVDTLPGAGGYSLTGTPGNDSLVGGTGNDVLDSVGGGIDTLVGGKGDDTYGIYNSADIITENLNEGTDTVWTAVNYILPANVENMYLVGSLNGTGNAGNNTIVGYGAGDNLIDGGAGNDTLRGGDGNDTLRGGTGNNTLNGDAGNDWLYSSASSVDNLAGGSGDDLYEVLNGLSTIVENAGEGTDTVFTNVNYTLAANVENMYLFGSFNGTGNAGDNTIVGYGAGDNLIDGGAGNDILLGGDGNDTLRGGTGNNTLNGDAGNDVLYSSATSVDNLAGGSGDDIYEVLNGLSTISENPGSGTDSVFTNVNYTLAANVENMYLYGSVNGTGNAGDNTIVGVGAGDNIIDGGAGNDTIRGGAGNNTLNGDAGNDALYNSATSVDKLAGGSGDDIYEVLNGLSTISENAGEGIDSVFTNVNYTLAANVENMYLYGSSNGTGNAGNNTIVGVGAGDNVINGGSGSDTLTGGAGNDTFVFDRRNLISQVISGIDTITDFTIGQDKIQLSQLAFNTNLQTTAGNSLLAGDFMIVTDDAAAATAAKAIVYNSANGHLFYNANLSAAGFDPNGGQFAQLTAGLNLTNTDFSLIAGSNPPI
jgi:Ca2+-binding RTX toxin-like protein